MIIFQVWLGKTISKVIIIKTNQTKKNHEEEDYFKNKCFSNTQVS